MAQIKAHEFERTIANGLPRQPIILVYGPDRGLVSERSDMLATLSGVDLDDPFSVIRLDPDTLKSDPARLIDEANSLGLFGGQRLIRVKGAGNERPLLETLSSLSDSPPPQTLILIEAGDLKKGTGLRKLVEDARNALAVPCYSDAGRAVHALIDAELSSAGLRIAGPARERLVDLLGGDRLASRGELQKLALYCKDKDVIDDDDVMAIIGDMAALSVDEAVDAILTGDLNAIDLSLQRVTASKTPIFAVLQACLRQFQVIEVLRCAIEADGKTISTVMNEHGRRIHFQRKAAVETSVRAWPLADLAAALDHLQKAILESRRQAALSDSIGRQALLALALRSAKRSAR